ncbi:MAG: A/G-specific adenine glycosylase [bacterium]
MTSAAEDLANALAPEIRPAMLGWFERVKRDLPWRQTSDAYAIWISEIMCQQTQVATVIPYWERWMAAFPDAQTLAATELDDVLSYWAGLGYYRRARMIHAAAKQIVDVGLPSDFEGWKALPGVGRYTAGAVASIAFDEHVAVVDGNVERVLSRLFMIGALASNSQREKQLWKCAQAIVDPERPGDFNQAIMELGALVCTPRSPKCDECPIQAQCQAFAAGSVASFPPPKKKTRVKSQVTHLVGLRHEGSYAFVQRPLDGLHGGLWEFPSADDSAFEAFRARHAQPIWQVGEFEHLFSHIRMTYRVHLSEAATRSDDYRWVDQPSELALSAAMQKALRIVEAE